MRWTEDQLQQHQARTNPLSPHGRAKAKRSKYNATKTIADGKVFASKGEAKRWADLELLQKEGSIRNLQRQVRYDIVWNGVHICSYTADAVYELDSVPGYADSWIVAVEDFKGARPREWARTKKLMLACHGIEIREVRA